MPKREVTDTMVLLTEIYLGTDGLCFFRECQAKYGTVSPVIPGPIPHPVHFREGMQIRNFLRGLDDCQSWSDHDFDDTWVSVIERVLNRYCPPPTGRKVML